MGLFDIFKKHNEQNSFSSFPDLTNYRKYIFLNGGEFDDIKAHMNEYHELYPSEAVFSTALYRLGDTSWSYIVLAPRYGAAETSPVWDYLNILLWMSEKADASFAYARPERKDELPVIAFGDENNQFGDSCKGIANGKYFYAAIPEQEITWGPKVSGKFDCEEYLRENYGVDVGSVM